MERQTNSSNHQHENNWNSKNSKGNEIRKLQKWKQSSQDTKKNKKLNDDPKIVTELIDVIMKGTQEAETSATTAKVTTAATIALNKGQFVADIVQLEGIPRMNRITRAILPENHDIIPDDIKETGDHQNEDRIDVNVDIQLQAHMIHHTNHRIEVMNTELSKIFDQPLNNMCHLGHTTVCRQALNFNGRTKRTWHLSQGFNLTKLQCNNTNQYHQCN